MFSDEIYMTNLYIYGKLLYFTEKCKDNSIIIGAGDTKQLEPTNDLANAQSKTTIWSNMCCSICTLKPHQSFQEPVKLSKGYVFRV